MHPDKIRSIFNLASENRYSYFIRKVADAEEVWLIKDGNSFLTLGDNVEQETIPVLSEQEFASFLLMVNSRENGETRFYRLVRPVGETKH